MNKPYQRNTKATQDILVANALKAIAPQVQRIIDEAYAEENEGAEPVNELFGFGEKAEKPTAEIDLTANTDEQNAEIILQYMAYYIKKAGNNVEEALKNFHKEIVPKLVKMPKLIAKAIIMVCLGTYKAVVAIPGLIILGIVTLARLAKQGIEGAKEALESVYRRIKEGLVSFYNAFKEKAEQLLTSAKESIQETIARWAAIAATVVALVVEKVEGAAEAFGEWIAQVCNDAKEKVLGAVCLVKSWLTAKAEAIQSYVSNKIGEARKAVVEAWNAASSAVRKAYNEAVAKVMEVIATIKNIATVIGEKIVATAEKIGDKVIDKRNAVLASGIEKAVKIMKPKYSEEDLVALVRKAYNEGLALEVDGTLVINEKYYCTASQRHALYE